MANQNKQKSRAILEVEVKSDIRKATDDLNQFSDAEDRAAQSTGLLATGLAGLASSDLSSSFKLGDLKTVIDILRDFPGWIKQIIDGFKGFTPFLRSFDEIQHELNVEARLKIIREVQIEIERVKNEMRQVQAEIDELNRKEEEFIRSGPPPGVDPRGGGFVSSFNLKRGLLEDQLLTLQLEKDRYVKILGELRAAQNAESQSNEELTDSLAGQTSATEQQTGATQEQITAQTQAAKSASDQGEALKKVADPATLKQFEDFIQQLSGTVESLQKFSTELNTILKDLKELNTELRQAAQGMGLVSREAEGLEGVTEAASGGVLPVLQQILAAVQSIEEALKQLPKGVQDGADQVGDAAKQMEQTHNESVDSMAQKIESFFQQVFLTARSFSDVWKQLLQQLLRLFVSFVAKMIAAWLSGMQTMRRGAGGILGSIFGALFGGGGFNLFGAAGGGQAAVAGGSAASAAAAAAPLAPPRRQFVSAESEEHVSRIQEAVDEADYHQPQEDQGDKLHHKLQHRSDDGKRSHLDFLVFGFLGLRLRAHDLTSIARRRHALTRLRREGEAPQAPPTENPHQERHQTHPPRPAGDLLSRSQACHRVEPGSPFGLGLGLAGNPSHYEDKKKHYSQHQRENHYNLRHLEQCFELGQARGLIRELIEEPDSAHAETSQQHHDHSPNPRPLGNPRCCFHGSLRMSDPLRAEATCVFPLSVSILADNTNNFQTACQ